MRIEKIALDRINPAPYNPREDLQPDDPDYIAIKTSIDKFGLVDPLVWNATTGNLVGGHQRYKIIKASGAAEAECSIVELKVEEEKELNFALNRALGRWHLPRLETLVGELKSLDIDIAYLRPEELLLAPGGAQDIIEDDVPPVPQEPRSRRGEIYGLGQHRLMCGDATSAEDVAQLMGGEKADAVITDPPYGIGRKGIVNDDIGNLPQLYEKALSFLPVESAIVVAFQSPRLFGMWLDAIGKKGHKFERLLWYYKPNGMRFPWRGWILKSDVICVSTIGSPKWPESPAACHDTYTINHKYELLSEDDWHASIKPNEIMVSLVGHTLGVVYDPFGGSGSTLIACEQLGRRCRMMEIDPLYCDVIRDRYAKFAGKAAPEPEIAAVPPLEAPEPKDTPPAEKAPPAPTSAPEPPPERGLPEEDDEEDYKEAFELLQHRWRIRADQASKIVGCTADLIRAPDGCGGHCCRCEMWPGLAGRPELQHCFWFGPEGCQLKPQDKPVACHRYPFVVNRKGELVLHDRLQGDDDYPCLYGRGDKMAIEALRGSVVALFGESEYNAALQAVRAGQNYDIVVPQPIALAQLRERKWAHANAIPVPRTLFDDGNAAVLDQMPRDKIEASMACLDGEPSKKGADAVAAKPAPVSAFPVGDADDVDTTDPASLPLPIAPPTPAAVEAMEAVGIELAPPAPEPEVVKSGPQGPPGPPAINSPADISEDTPTLDDLLSPETVKALKAMGPVGKQTHTFDGPTADGPAMEAARAEPTLEEVAAKKGIFEALQRPVPPHVETNPELVLDFETPVEAHALPRGGTVYVKRDDLFAVAGVRGGKARTCWALATAQHDMSPAGLITAGSRQSPQCNIVAHIARRLGVPCRLHIPKAKAALEGELAEAEALGAEIVQHKPGYNTVIVARAREDAQRSPGWVHIPFGMAHEEAVQQTRRQARVLERYGRICERMVVPVGSGMSLAGILWGMRDAGALGALPVLGICVGADPRRRLDEYAPSGWRDTVTLKDAPTDYHKPATRTRLGDLELDPGYEAKCLPYLKAGDLLWVVGIRNSVLGRQGLK